MDRWILTAVCVAGLGGAGALTWRWRGVERLPREPLPGGVPGAKRALRQFAVLVDTAFVVGILVAGLGGRLLMRVIAATSPDSLFGVRTDADEPIGRVTVGGTIGLIIFGGLLGALALGVVYRLLRRWLPSKGWQAGLVAATIVMALLGDAMAVLKPDSKDFAILSPLWLAVAMVLVLAAAVGVAFGVVFEHFDHVVPELNTARSALAYVPLALVCLAVTPAAIIGVTLVLAAFAAPAVNWLNRAEYAKRGGQVLLTAAFVASVGVNAARAAEILG